MMAPLMRIWLSSGWREWLTLPRSTRMVDARKKRMETLALNNLQIPRSLTTIYLHPRHLTPILTGSCHHEATSLRLEAVLNSAWSDFHRLIHDGNLVQIMWGLTRTQLSPLVFFPTSVDRTVCLTLIRGVLPSPIHGKHFNLERLAG